MSWSVLLLVVENNLVNNVQAKLPLKLRLKLIVMMSLSIHMMTSQGRMCVQCVRNGLQRDGFWNNTQQYTVEKRCIHVVNVRRVFRHGARWFATRIFTQADTSARNVASVVRVAVAYQYTAEVIQERNRLNVTFVANDLCTRITLLSTAEFTAERNRTNAFCAAKRSVYRDF